VSDEIQFTCSECGKQFPADPDAMVEMHMGVEARPSWEADKLTESGEAIEAIDLEQATPEDLKAAGITPEQRDALLKGENVTVGGVCICRECQDRLGEEQKDL